MKSIKIGKSKLTSDDLLPEKREIIFLSSDIERESILYKNVKYAEFMQKPLTINEIQTTISRLLELKI